MINVLFTCPWMDNEKILNSYKRNTPNNSGIWKKYKWSYRCK